MNKIMRMLVEIPVGIVKAIWNVLLNCPRTHISLECAMSPFSEICVDRPAQVTIGRKYRQRSGARVRVRKNGQLNIGTNVMINHGCMIVCRERICIGNDVQFAPNVMVYDHDHDYMDMEGVRSMKYLTSPIEIGNNVWIGANSVILRGTIIGDNCVIAAGSVIKGTIPANSMVYQKKETSIKVLYEK